MENEDIYLTSLEQIAMVLDHQTFDERLEFAEWLSNIEDKSVEGIAFALSLFSIEHDYDYSIESQLGFVE